MKKCWLLFLVLSCTLLAESKDWTQYVNPLMGTQSSFELSTGNTYPAIARPWGMNFWTPLPFSPVCGLQKFIPQGTATAGYVLPWENAKVDSVPIRGFT